MSTEYTDTLDRKVPIKERFQNYLLNVVNRFLPKKEQEFEYSRYICVIESPSCVLVGEKLEIMDGVFRRTGMILDAEKLLKSQIISFSPVHVGDIFRNDTLFRHMTHDELIVKFNDAIKKTVPRETRKHLKSWDRFTILEFREIPRMIKLTTPSITVNRVQCAIARNYELIAVIKDWIDYR